MDKKVRLLVVEDNEINREVVLDILEPLNADIDSAKNGEEAVKKVLSEAYDLVFMDYLMPVMDGAVATKQIRHTEGREDLRQLPIVALTASEDELDTLLDSGMNDYIIKPLHFDAAVSKLSEWLPKEAFDSLGADAVVKVEETESFPEIEGIDFAAAEINSGSGSKLKKLFKNYSNVISWKAALIEDYLKDGKLSELRTEVHALKSSSNLIGAVSLSKRFEELEKRAKDGDHAEVRRLLPEVLKEYRAYTEKLKPVTAKEEQETVEVSKERLNSILKSMIRDAEGFYLDGVDAAMTELEKCSPPSKLMDDFLKLRAFVSDVSMTSVIETAQKMIEDIKSM